MSKPLVNILIRFQGNFKALDSQLKNIAKQSYKNLRVIIQYTESNYFEKMNEIESQYDFNIHQVVTDITTTYAGKPAKIPQNIFLNQMISEVKEGICLVVNHDEKFINNYAISRIIKGMKIGNARTFNTIDTDGVLIPNTACFYVSDAKGVFFDAMPKAEFRFLQKLQRQNVTISIFEGDFLRQTPFKI